LLGQVPSVYNDSNIHLMSQLALFQQNLPNYCGPVVCKVLLKKMAITKKFRTNVIMGIL